MEGSYVAGTALGIEIGKMQDLPFRTGWPPGGDSVMEVWMEFQKLRGAVSNRDC